MKIFINSQEEARAGVPPCSTEIELMLDSKDINNDLRIEIRTRFQYIFAWLWCEPVEVRFEDEN